MCSSPVHEDEEEDDPIHESAPNDKEISHDPTATPSLFQLVADAKTTGEGQRGLGSMDDDHHNDDDSFAWTPWTVAQSILLFLITGVFEIGGGWLVWQAVREGKPWWYAVVGSVVLVGYGFWPTLQHTGESDSFGRIYAIYGGFFIVGSFLAGWVLDGDRPDKGDWIGGSITLAGVMVILFWPRTDAGGGDDQGT